MDGKAAGLLTLDYNFGGTSHSGIDVPRIVGSENRLSCMIYDVSRRGYDRSYPRNAKWRVRLPQVAIRQLKISRCSVSNRGRMESCIVAFRTSPVFCRV